MTVTQNATCGSGNEATTSFGDTPLTNVSVNAHAQLPGATNSTITCTDSGGNTVGSSGPAGDPANASATGLKPGTYTCTIVIDP